MKHLPDSEYILIGNKSDQFMSRVISTTVGQVNMHTN